MLKEVLKDRMEEVKEELKHFTVLKRMANTKRDELYYELRVVQLEGQLEALTMGLELVEERANVMRELKKDMDKLFNKI
jgi:hypothetical protein